MSPHTITARESIYLDFLRAAASLAVLVSHAASVFNLRYAPLWGHEAVVVFFVLSGYVICNVADTREKTLQVFAVARLSRLWSVLVPAIALTIACDVIGRRFGVYPAAYAHVPADFPVMRTLAILTFTSESWVSIQPFSNGAAWSLCVEFWYYALFAACCFMPGGASRIVALSFAALMSGHKALLLLPIWLMGVALQRAWVLRRIGPAAGIVCFVVGGAGAALILQIHAYGPPTDWAWRHFNPWVMHQLAQARVFWMDWLLGLLVAIHLLGARMVAARVPLERVAWLVRRCAGVSFAAYLFHMPLLILCRGFLPASQGLLALALTVAAIAVIGPPAERSKHRWRIALNRCAGGLLALGRGGRPGVGGLPPMASSRRAG